MTKRRTVQLRRLARLRYGDALPQNARRHGDVPVFASGGRVGWHNHANTCAPVIVLGRKGSYGSVHWSDEPVFVIDTAYAIDASSATCDLRWLYYVIVSTDLRALSQDVGIPGLSRELVHELRVPVISRAEQQAIAVSLDRECAKIARLENELMALQRVLDQLLRDSASRLLHGLPVAPLKYRIQRIDQGWSPECEVSQADAGEWGVLKVGCVNYGEFRPMEHKRLPDSLEPRQALAVRVGDLVMSRANTRELVGSAAVITDVAGRHLMLSDKHYRLHLMPGHNPHFVAMAVNSSGVREQIEAATAGASSSMQNISQQVIRSLLVPVADTETQRRIASDYARVKERIQRARAEIAALIDELAEYRRALITEAVIGMRDAREMNERMHAMHHNVEVVGS